MAYFGVQYRGAVPAAATEALAEIAGRFRADSGPSHWDRAQYVDQAGHTNVVSVAYCGRRRAFRRLVCAVARAWTGRRAKASAPSSRCCAPPSRATRRCSPSLGRPEGVAVIADDRSGEVQEHAYWGGMRDRIPLSQTDAMAPGGAPELIRDGARLRVQAHDNLCLIRSGQDWSDTEASERKLYLDDVEPVLREGMDFLRDDGLGIGCYANRYMRVVAVDGSVSEKSYGQSWWKSLAALERWAESHPTHVRIFGARDEVSIDARAVGKAAALSRGYGGGRRRAVLRISELPPEDRHAGGGRDGRRLRFTPRNGRAARDARRRCDARRHPRAPPRCHSHRARRSRSCRWSWRRPRRGCGRRS